jgi:TolB-like protein
MLLFLASAQPNQAQVTVAIGDFNNQSEEFYLDAWEKSIPEYLKSDMGRSDKVVLVERRQIESVLREQALTMSGLVDSSTAQKVGNLVGAQFVVSGTINKSGEWTRIDTRIIRVSTGHIKSETVRATDEDHLNEMVELLANNILHVLVGDIPYREKIELKKYPTTYFLLASAGLAVTAIILNNSYQTKLDQYRNAQELSQFDNLYDSANQLYKTRNVIAVVAGTALLGTIYCWIRNLSPNEILALNKTEQVAWIPTLNLDYNKGIQAGVTIHF